MELKLFVLVFAQLKIIVQLNNVWKQQYIVWPTVEFAYTKYGLQLQVMSQQNQSVVLLRDEGYYLYC